MSNKTESSFDLRQLKALALAYETENRWWYTRDQIADGITDEVAAKFIAAASPAVVLDLIARIERSEHEFKNFHRSLCARFGYTHDERDWKRDQVSLEEHIAGRIERAASPAPTAELLAALDSLRLKLQFATPSIDQIHEVGADGPLEEAWQIYYDEVMPALARAKAASGATASGDELPPLPQAWRKVYERPSGVQELLYYTADDMQSYARAAVSAATKPTADLSKLDVYEFSAFEDGKRQQYLLLADVQSLLATKPAAPQGEQQ